LDEILDVELRDTTAWTLQSDGSYVQDKKTASAVMSAQSFFAERAAVAREDVAV
jgi:hypothetical protein